MYKCINIHNYVSAYVCMYAKQKHPGCKKVRGQEEPATKSSDIKYGQEVCE